jgi:HD-GYP domain-containing protein (c-di-GMP phosphodiesterase class II)
MWLPDFEDRRKQESSLIAVIDNMPDRRQRLVKLLKPYYRVVDYEDGNQAMSGLMNNPPAAALVAERLPPLGGYEFVKSLRGIAELEQIPVVLVVKSTDQMAHDGLRWCGANRLLPWPNHPSTALMLVSSMCSLHVQRRWEALSAHPRQALNQTLSVFNEVSKTILQGGTLDVEHVRDACTSLVTALNNNHFLEILEAVKGHDDYTYVHCLRVATFLSMFGHITGLPMAEQVLLAAGGLLHDIGKIMVDYDILNKPGPLNKDEFGVIKTHVQATVDLLQAVPDIRAPILTVAAQHHERLDGTGYPIGLDGKHLNELARMAAVVDVFGALTDRRTYKAAMEPEKALDLMMETMSRKLDMRLLAIFRQAMLDAAIFSKAL